MYSMVNRKTFLKPTGNLIRIAGSELMMGKFSTLFYDVMEISSNKLASLLKSGPGYHFVLAQPDGKQLAKAVNTLDQVAKANPVIDSIHEFTLPAVVAAYEKCQSARAKGKIVIRIAPLTAAL
ncbi:hypothetical protein BGZ72_006707 [Mortierella alpina]|nr:hypothetical protein BGZ72_006707 [Mortierella alpina]